MAKAKDKQDEVDPLAEREIELWKDRLADAKKHHEPYWEKAKRFRQEYLGPHDGGRDKGATDERGKPINLISSFVNTLIATVFPDTFNPVIEAKWPGDEYRQAARLLEARTRDVLTPTRVYRQIYRAIFESFFLCGFVLLGWVPKGSREAVRLGVPDEEGLETDVQVDLARAHGHMYANVDEPSYRHLPYERVRMDPKGLTLDATSWIAYEADRRLVDLQADDTANNKAGIYQDTDKIKGSGGDSNEADAPKAKDKMVKVWTAFEHGRRDGELKVVVMAGGNFTEIRQADLKLGLDGWPIRSVGFHDVARLFPASPEQFWFDMHDSFNEFMAEATERTREAKNIVVVPSKKVQDQVTMVGGNMIIICPNKEQIATIPLGGVRPETWKAAETYERMVDKVSGVSDFHRGIESESGKKLATELLLMEKKSANRLDGWLGSVQRFGIDLIGDTAGMLIKLQWQDVPVRLDSGGARPEFGIFNNTVVPPHKAAYEFNIDVSGRQRMSPALRQKRASETLTILLNPALHQLAAREGKVIHVTPAVEDYLETLFVRDIERYITDAPQPQELAAEQTAMAQQENQQMLATGQPAPVNPGADDHGVHAKIHLDAAGESGAIAEHLGEHYAHMEAAGAPQAGTPAMPPSRIAVAPGGGRRPPSPTQLPAEGGGPGRTSPAAAAMAGSVPGEAA